MARPLPHSAPARVDRIDGELRYLSLDDEAREDLDPSWQPRTRGALALAPQPTAPQPTTKPRPPDLGGAVDRQDKVAALRAHLARVAPAPSIHRQPALPSGIPDLDRLVGGWPRPGVSEILGRPGSGRLSLLLPVMRAVSLGSPPLSSPRPVAIVDPQGTLHPPGLPGLPLDQVLLVRPGSRALWATEQLARSGALPLVILVDPAPLGRGARRLLHAAEAGACSLVLLSEGKPVQLPVAVRLQATGKRRFRVTRGARGDATVCVPD